MSLIRILNITLLALLIFVIFSCGRNNTKIKKTYIYHYKNQPCTVIEYKKRAVVTCPDGSSAEVKYVKKKLQINVL